MPTDNSLREAVALCVRKFVAEFCDPDPTWTERDKAEAATVSAILALPALASQTRQIAEMQAEIEGLRATK